MTSCKNHEVSVDKKNTILYLHISPAELLRVKADTSIFIFFLYQIYNQYSFHIKSGKHSKDSAEFPVSQMEPQYQFRVLLWTSLA